MTGDELRSWCLSMEGAVETFPFRPGTSVFKAVEGGRIFAISALDEEPLRVSVKCHPDEADMLREEHEAVVPGYHLNKRHWITITLGGDLPDEEVRGLLTGSYELVRPRRGRRSSTSQGRSG